MKRHTEYLVRKRDGRLEWLRATKLARSVRHAFGDDEVIAEDAILCLTETIVTALTETIVTALTETSASETGGEPIPSAALAEAVEHTLRCLGRGDAAERYAAEGRSRRRRRALLESQCDALASSIAEQASTFESALPTGLPGQEAPESRRPAPERPVGMTGSDESAEGSSLDKPEDEAETSSMAESLARKTPTTRSSRCD